MAYKPQLPPLLAEEECGSSTPTDSPSPARPVTPVTAVTHLLGMTLAQFGNERLAIEVAVPWLQSTLWFVPGGPQVDSLVRRGIARGRIWTAAELTDLLKIQGPDTNGAVTIARAKVEFGAEVISVTPGASESADEQGAAQAGESRSG